MITVLEVTTLNLSLPRSDEALVAGTALVFLTERSVSTLPCRVRLVAMSPLTFAHGDARLHEFQRGRVGHLQSGEVFREEHWTGFAQHSLLCTAILHCF